MGISDEVTYVVGLLNFGKGRTGATFDRIADAYETYRIPYHCELTDVVLDEAGVPPAGKLLEVGSGTGKGTELFAARDLDILCVEPGENLVNIARNKFARCGNVKFHVSTFEEFEASARSFDLVYFAQSFHWVEQPAGFQKCADILKDGGALVLLWNMYVADDNEHDRRIAEFSKGHDESNLLQTESQCEQRIEQLCREVEESGIFSRPSVHRRLWERPYTLEDYLGFMKTTRIFRCGPEHVAEKIESEIRRLFENTHSGEICRRFLSVAQISRKI